jgi:TP901 family phage tail tape measure protein
MADIVQKLGFDASDAIAQIALLNSALGQLNGMLGDTGTSISKWNSVGGVAVSQFNSMKTAADAARKAVEALSNAQNAAATAAVKSGVTPTQTPVSAPPANMAAYVAQIEAMGAKLGAVPAQASEASRRSYASAMGNLAEYAQKNKLSMNDIGMAWTNSSKTVTGAANVLANKVQDVKNAHARMADSVQQDTGRLGTSMGFVVKMFAFQAIHQAINGLISLFKSAVTDAIDFGKRLGEIGTILGKPFTLTKGEIGAVGEEIKRLSATYGSSAKDVAEAYYQTLSNQVGNATQSMHVLDAAMRLGVSTNSSAADSVALLTATINAYGLSTDQAAQASGVLFKAIELGRFRATDMANIIGRVGSLAREMGISLEESMAFFTTMTVQGVRADTAVTQLRAVITQLLKPTRELTALFKERWGVENAQEAINMFGGLIPLLQALEKEAGGSTQEMAEFFKNVRALTGVMQTTGSSAARLQKDFNLLNDAGSNLIEWASKFVMDTPAKQAEVAWNKLKITMQGFAEAALPTLTKLIGLVDSLLKNTTALGIGVGVLIGAPLASWFIKISEAARVAAVAQATLAASSAAAAPALTAVGPAATTAAMGLGRLFTVIAGGAVLIGVFYLMGRAVDELILSLDRLNKVDISKGQEEWKKAQEKRMAQMRDDNAEAIRLGEARAREELSVVTQISAAQNLYRNEMQKGMRNEDAAFSFSVKKRLGDMIRAQENVVHQIDTIAANSANHLRDIEKERVSNTMSLQDREVKWKLDRATEGDKLIIMSRRARDLAEQASAGITKATTLEQLDDVKKLIEDSKKWAASATDAAQSMGKSGGDLASYHNREINAYRIGNDLLNKRVELVNLQAQKAQEIAVEEQNRLKDMKEAIATIIKASTTRTQKGPKSLEDIQKEQAAAQVAFSKLYDTSKEGLGRGMGVNELLGLTALEAKINEIGTGLPSMYQGMMANSGKSVTAFKDELKTIPKDIQIKFDLKLGDGWEKLQQIFDADTKKATEIHKSVLEAQEALKTGIGGENKNAASQLADLAGAKFAQIPWSQHEEPGTAAAKKQAATVDAINSAYKAVIKSATDLLALQTRGEATSKDTLAYREKVARFENDYINNPKSKAMISAGSRENWSDVKKTMDERIAGFAELQKTWPNIKKDQEEELRLEERRKQIQDAMTGRGTALSKDPVGNKIMMEQLDNILGKTGAIGTSIDANTRSTDLSREAVKQLESAWDSAAAAKARMDDYGMGGAGFAFGGLVHLAAGGRGTDTELAMLSPGEFVMNATATRRFASQLVAMNAGVTPQGRATGGPITNFGDINVSVNGGGSSQQTARNTAIALRRELRRGTSALG